MAYASIILYLLGAFMTWVWWIEVSGPTNKNLHGLLTVIFWPLVAIMGMLYVFSEWLRK